MVEFGRRLAFVAYSKGNIDSALVIYETILPIARIRRPARFEKILNMMALCYSWQAKYDRALALNFEALGIRQSRDDTVGMATSLNNIGLVFYKLKDYDKALRYFSQTLELQKRFGDDWLEPLLTNIGLCYAYSERLDSARHFFNRAAEICYPDCESFVTVQIEFGHGVVNLAEREITEAKSHFMKSYLLAKTIRDDRLLLDNLYYLAAISLDQDNIQEAIRWMQVASNVSATSSSFNLEFAKIYKRIADVYEKMGDVRNGAFYLDKYIALRDSIYNQERIFNMMRTESRYLERENVARIKAQNILMAAEASLIRTQRWVALSFTLLGIVATIVVITLYRTLRQRRRFSVILAERLAERISALRDQQFKATHITLSANLRVRKICTGLTRQIARLRALCRETPANGAATLDPECILRIQTTAARMDRVVRHLEHALTRRHGRGNTLWALAPNGRNTAPSSPAHKL